MLLIKCVVDLVQRYHQHAIGIITIVDRQRVEDVTEYARITEYLHPHAGRTETCLGDMRHHPLLQAPAFARPMIFFPEGQ